jgi:hypothetical protein
VENRGLPRNRFLEPHTYFEREARRAAARILRNHNKPVPYDVRDALAELIEPTPSESEQHTNLTAEREISFSRREKHGRPRQWVTNTFLVDAVFQLKKEGKSLEEAAANVSTKYGVSESWITKLWSSCRKTFPTMYY